MDSDQEFTSSSSSSSSSSSLFSSSFSFSSSSLIFNKYSIRDKTSYEKIKASIVFVLFTFILFYLHLSIFTERSFHLDRLKVERFV
jgi:hypothetical protein